MSEFLVRFVPQFRIRQYRSCRLLVFTSLRNIWSKCDWTNYVGILKCALCQKTGPENIVASKKKIERTSRIEQHNQWTLNTTPKNSDITRKELNNEEERSFQ